MLKNYLKIALRNLRRHKGYSFINISGLALSIACCLLIALYIQHELCYDRYHENADRIFRVCLDRRYPTNHVLWAPSAPGVAAGITREFPEVQTAVRLATNSTTVTYGDKSFNEDHLLYADSTFFEVFTLPLVQGDSKTALKAPNSVVISAAMVQKYFGEENPLGKALSFADGKSYMVTAVARDYPLNSHFHFDFLVSLTSMANRNLEVWDTNFGFHTYILLRPNASAPALEAKLPLMARKYLTRVMANAEEYDKWLAAGNEYRYFLQPLTSIHLHSNLKWEIEPNGDITYIYLFGAIGAFILFIACINFMNLATARSLNRAQEVGVRKVVGSQRQQLISQFLFEAILLSAIAMVLAVFLAELVLPAFNQLLGKSLVLNYEENKKILAALISFTIFVGVIAGSYPAFFLSSFRPVAVLKGTLLQGIKKNNFRNVLVVTQFAISIIMIAGTAVVFRQMNFMSNKKLGFDKEHVVVIHRAWPLASKAEAFKQELLRGSNIIKVAISGNSPGIIAGAGTYRPKDRPDEISLNMAMLGGDSDIIETMGMELAAGRNFRPSDLTDTTRYVILNETAAKQFGWADDPIGKQLLGSQNDRPVFQIIGVVKDFHFESLHKGIRPLIYFLSPDWVGAVSVRINPTDIRGTLAFLERKWKEFVPNAAFEFSFLDEDLQALYQTERTTGKLFVVFSTMAIFIACLGLFGLASFMAEQRTKEIAVRKVLGATVSSIVGLLSQDFVKLVLLANIFAWPLAYFAMNKWLQDFAYRIDIGWWVFVFAGGMALVIALLTVSFQAIKAALANPVEALRYE